MKTNVSEERVLYFCFFFSKRNTIHMVDMVYITWTDGELLKVYPGVPRANLRVYLRCH